MLLPNPKPKNFDHSQIGNEIAFHSESWKEMISTEFIRVGSWLKSANQMEDTI
jgi:hypothetical protein